MKKEELWNRFFSTGRIDDYLKYIDTNADDEVCDTNATDKNNRADN